MIKWYVFGFDPFLVVGNSEEIKGEDNKPLSKKEKENKIKEDSKSNVDMHLSH